MSKFGYGTDVADTTTVPQEANVPESGYEFPVDEGGGQFPPRITPGPVTFRYECIKHTANVPVQGQLVDEIEFTAHVQVAALSPGRLLIDKGESEIKVPFCRASTYRSEAMIEKHVQSGAERLYQALGLLERIGPPKSKAELVNILQNTNGSMGQASLIWRAVSKRADGTTEIFSSNPNPKRLDSHKNPDPERAWPRAADGSLEKVVTFADGTQKMAREELGRLFVQKRKKTG